MQFVFRRQILIHVHSSKRTEAILGIAKFELLIKFIAEQQATVSLLL